MGVNQLLCLPRIFHVLLVVCIFPQSSLIVSGQGEWSGFVNSLGSLLDFTCSNNSVITGIASNFSRGLFDREWEFLCGTGGGLASVVSSCTLQPAINTLQGEISFSCPGDGYLSGFRSEFTGPSYDRVWEPYCCTRPASALINCQLPTSRYENDLRGNLNFTASTDSVIVGLQSFYFNRDRRWRYQTCQLEVSCGDPGVPANGRRIGDQFLYRDRVTFVCDDGYYQSSGPRGGTRECLITGQWSETQPVCSQCQVIESCAQVLCTNTSDHLCMECESNYGPMLGQRAYTNLQTQCQARCSWLGVFCYPGVCPNTPDSCNCTMGFQGQSCLQISESPSLPSCSLILEGADGNQLTTLCLPTNQTSDLFTNISPYQLRGMWEGFYTGPTLLPPRPAYIPSNGYEVGVAISVMVASIYRAANPTDAVSQSSHGCDVAPPSPDQPRPGLTSCSASALPTSLSNHTFLHGDTFDVMVRVEAGGFLDVINLDTGIATRQYYTGTPTIGGAMFILDFQPPVHCSLLVPSCLAGQPLLSLSGEMVSDSNVSISWGGWLDQPAGVSAYLLTLYRLEQSGGMQFEGAQIRTTLFNETGQNVYEDMTLLSMEGSYSFVLESFDNAGNIRFSRRLLLFDGSSTLNIDSSAPLIVTSAVNTWQNSTDNPIIISGRGHFYNSLLRDRNLLAPVADIFNGSISPDYDHPLVQGRYPRGGTPNALGVVSLRYDFVIDQAGGQSAASLMVPDTFRFATDDLGIESVSITTALEDGDSVTVWFLATDYNFQQVNDSVVVHVDSTPPLLAGLSLVRHGLEGLNLHGQDSLTDLRLAFDVEDEHSGVMSIEWSLGTEQGLADVGNGNVPVQVVARETCMPPECVCDSVHHCSLVHHTFSPLLSDLTISSLANHDAEYHITIVTTNHALLSTQLSLVFTVDTTPPLPGAVFDGPPTGSDVDYDRSLTLRGYWQGFFDRESDVLFYEYVFGSECANSSFFTNPLEAGSVAMETNMETATMQASGEGTYFLTVVAWNSALSPSEPVCSNGLTVDMLPPVFEGVVIPGGVVEGGLVRDPSDTIWLVGSDRRREVVREGDQDPNCLSIATPISDLSAYPIRMAGFSPSSVSADVCLVSPAFSTAQLTLLPVDHTLNISWLALDNVGFREFYVGIVPAENYSVDGSGVEYKPTAGQPHFSITNPDILQNGVELYISVRAQDLALHSTTVTVGPILIDLTPPSINGSLYVRQQQGHVIVTWDEETFTEEEEGAAAITLRYAVGLTGYSDSSLFFRPLPLTTPTECPHSRCIAIDPSSQDVSLTSGKSYFFTVSSTNRAGLTSFLTSYPYYYVSATPTPGLVLDFDPLSSVGVYGGSSYHRADIDVLLEGEELGVRWTGFAHPYAPILYSVCLGLSPGSHDVVPHTLLGSGVTSHVFRGTALLEGSTYYATVVANTGFSSANSSSNGVLVFREGRAALKQATVYDGSSDVDIEYQASSSQISSQWFFPSHIHANISHYMWGVLSEGEEAGLGGRQPLGSASASGSGSTPNLQVVMEYQHVGKDTSAIGWVGGAGLRDDGTVYVNAVRACFATYCLPAVHSDGFRISTPPIPGSITARYTPLERDRVYGTSSSGRLELMWEDFTEPQLSYYEWSLGTGEGDGGAGAELLVQWREVEWFENQLTVMLNVTISLHRSNVVTLRGYNSAGLYATTSAALWWNVDGVVLPQNSVPRTPLVVYDISAAQVTNDPSLTDWRELTYTVVNIKDIEYTASSSSLSGAWPALRYTQYNFSVSSQQAYQPCSSRESQALACGSTFHNSAVVSSLSLVEGRRYYFCVRALREHAIHGTAATHPVLEACSNGVTVDLSPPRGGCVKIVPPLRNGFGQVLGSGGGRAGGGMLRPDLRRNCGAVNETVFQVSTSDLYLIWEEFTDVEEFGNTVHVSAVAYYSYAIGTSPLSDDIINFTPVGVATYAAIRGLTLQSGITYYATIRAVDFTGQSSYVVSPGVSVDTTKPVLSGVELTGFTQFQNDLQVEWNLVTDDESDILSLEWGLGTRPGSSDVIGWSETGLDQNTGVQPDVVQLDLFDGQIIFASLKVKNGAGLVSVASSSSYTLDSSPPNIGAVFDGPPAPSPSDVDYWTDEGLLAAHWRGFNDPHTGIAEYWWAIGTCRSCTDVQPFISVGRNQAALHSDPALSAGGRYYVTVCACNPHDICSQASSDGATLDTTPPIRGRVLDGLVGEDVQYQPSPLIVSAHWVGFHDTQSLIRNFVYYAGLSPNGSDLIPPTTIPADHTSFLHLLAMPLSSGTRVHTTVVAYNRAGLSSSSTSDGVVIDAMPPTILRQPTLITGWVGSRFGESQFSSSALRIAWNFTDNFYSVHHYFVSITSDSRTRISIPSRTVINADTLSLSGLALSDGKTYQAMVIGCDLAGLCTSSSLSLPVLVDSSPPIDGYFAVGSQSVANLTHARTVSGGMTWRNRPFRNVAELNLAFLGFSDPHSQVAEYWASVGSRFSALDLLQPTRLMPTLAANDSVEIYLATVTLSRQVNVSEPLYISLWAVNSVGLSSHVVQASFMLETGARPNNGSLVLLRSPNCAMESCLGHCTCAARGGLCNQPSLPATCTPLSPTTVAADRMLRVYNTVPQLSSNATPTIPLFTSITDKLYGRWELVVPSSQAIQRLEWSVGIQDDLMGPGAGLIDPVNGVVWRDADSSMSAVFTVLEDYPVVTGEVYVFYVRAWYNFQEYSIFTSEGVVVDVAGPVNIRGRRVREGIAQSRDLDFSSAPSSLSIAWDRVFSTTLSGNYSNFELGIGNFPGSDNVYPLMPIPSVQMVVNVTGLSLEQGVVYYSTLRATNALGMSTTSISDGVVMDSIPPDVGVVLGGRGMRYVRSPAQTERDMFSLRFYGFNDLESEIHHYEVAVSNSSTPLPLFQYENVGVMLQATLTGLTLTPGQAYYAHVVSVNRAGLRSPEGVSRGVVIQDNRPVGRVCQVKGPELLANPSFESDTVSGVPCPSQQNITMATAGWDLDTSYVTVSTYPETSPPHGCSAIGFIGSISQSFLTLPGDTYLLSFSYRYMALPHRAAVRVQLPGVDRLVFRPETTRASIVNTGWQRAHIEFVPTDNVSLVLLSSALSDSPVYIDQVTITGCRQYQTLVSTDLSVTWPTVIRLNHQVIASSNIRVSASWCITDPLSGVREFWWAIGNVPGGEQLQMYRPTGPIPQGTSDKLAVSDGQEVHITVLARSNAGRELVVHSGPYLVDLTPPPYNGGLLDGVGEEDVDYQSSRLVGVNWSGLVDRESGLELCSWTIGTSPGLSDVQQHLPIPILAQNTTATSDLSASLQHGATVYSTVMCFNRGGLSTSATTDGLTILYQPPTSHNAFISISSPTHTQYRPLRGYLPTPAITIQWDGFVESAGTPLEYEVRVLEEGVIGQANWTSLSSAKVLSLYDLYLPENVTSHMIEIRAVNLGGVVSDSIRTSFAIVSSPPQDTGLAINASWSGDNELVFDWSGKFTSPAPLYFEISVGTQMGNGRISRWVELSMTQTSYTVQLRRDMDYFIAVTAISSSGLHTTSTEMLAGLPRLG